MGTESTDVALDEQAGAVIARWNPSGARLLRRATDEDVPEPVHVVGPPRAGKTSLIETLRRHSGAAPQPLEFTESAPSPMHPSAVVLFVFDAGAAMGREELALLEQVGDRAARVVFVLTKTDLHRDWQKVLGRNRRVLADHAAPHAHAPIHPVSGDSEVEKLLAVLIAAVREVPKPPLGAFDVVEQTRAMIVTTAESVRENDPATVLKAERAELLAHRDGRRAERVARMRSEGQLAKVELLHEIASWSRTAAANARSEIARAGRKDLAVYPERLSDVVAESTRDIGRSTDVRLAAMNTRLGVENPADGVPHSDRVFPVVEMPDGPEPRHRGLEDGMTILIGASAGLGLGRLVVSPLAMVPALDIATIPVTLLLGALAAWWLTRARAHVAERAHLRQWAADAVVHVRAQLEQFVMAGLVDAEARAGEEIMRQSRAHALEVDDRVTAIDAEIRRTSRRRSGQLAACDRDLEALDAALRADVRHTGPAAAEPNGGPARLIT